MFAQIELPDGARDSLARSRFLRGLSAEQRELLAASGTLRSLTAGARLLRRGALAEELLLVVSGEVRREIDTPEASAELLAEEDAGALFGSSLLEDRPERNEIVASCPVSLIAWTKAELEQAERRAPGLLKKLTAALSLRAREAELVAALRRVTLFHGTSPMLLARMVRRAALLLLEPGTFVCRQGEPGSSFFHLLSGEVVVTKQPLASGIVSERTLNVLQPGSSFGEASLIYEAPRNASVRTTKPSELLAIDVADFEALLGESLAFRRSVQALDHERSGVLSHLNPPADLWWIISRSSAPAELLAGRLSEALFADFGERAELIEARADNASGFVEQVAALRHRAGVSAVFVHAEREREPGVWQALEALHPRVLFFTAPGLSSTPERYGIPGYRHFVEVSSEGRRANGAVRRGVVRVVLPEGSRLEGAFEAPVRTAFSRIARHVTDRIVGVALGGGAAWGFAHVPLLRGLYRAGIPIDIIAGVSVGSMVGALYSSRGLAGLEALSSSRIELTLRAAACLFSSRAAAAFMRRHLRHRWLEELPVPFYPIAVDIHASREQIFSRGSIADAVRASCSLPGVFGSTEYAGRRYVDGCVMNNVPVSALVEEGADLIIASSVIPAPRGAQNLGAVRPLSRIADSLRALFLLYNATGLQQAAAADVVFSPDLSEFSPVDFAKAPQIVERAERDAELAVAEAKERFRALARSDRGSRSPPA